MTVKKAMTEAELRRIELMVERDPAENDTDQYVDAIRALVSEVRVRGGPYERNGKFPHNITLTVGDWSADGHGQTHVVSVNCNFDKAQLETAYKKGTKKLKVDLTKTVAADYEDCNLPIEQWEKFTVNNLSLEQLFKDADYELAEAKEGINNGDGFSINVDAFVDLWLFTAKQGDPLLEYELVEDNKTNINIGGYGLLGS